MSTASTPTPPHILVYPFPAPGHIIPLVELTHRLLSRDLIITLAITHSNLTLLNPPLSFNSQLQQLVLPDPEIPPNSRNGLLAIMRSMRQLHHPLLLNWLQSNTSPPVAIISDFFHGWTRHFGLPRIVFSPSGAFAFCFSACIWRDLPQNDDPENLNFLVSFPKIPNSPTCPWWQLPNIYKLPKGSDWEFYRECNLDNLASWGIVFNTFTELEGVYLDHIKVELGKDRVWAVGPLLPMEDDLPASANRGGASSVPIRDVLTWLDSKKDHSVVYVCFGSRGSLTFKQVDELATGLEKSGVNFIWCVRPPDNPPDGFEDGVAGRGFIIKGWAPQLAILRHRAVGAFLSHCGWNSVLEAISAGVPMLTWPTGSDQFTNAQLLVDELGMGIRVGEATEKIPESSELGRILGASVEENLPERLKAKKMQRGVKGGRSDKDLDGLVRRLKEFGIKG